MNKKVKLVVCNEPQNCETVKELAVIIKECEKLAQKWRENPELIWGMSGLNGCADELEVVLGKIPPTTPSGETESKTFLEKTFPS